ncbi:O-antigen ligase family protein [Rossellomorea vietnamensis]|uniref:O-antigen ligase family protein n=1 Tax=Rossellomorea vietnamensis TaxID=218284 RepID=A0A5D4K6H2_9BACI|nr:O-antigen ligase family protein [Rossellomorea vietnamensis]TYR72626.1 O-antigen ligase family protein [Rossellomorea vietnamensis]
MAIRISSYLIFFHFFIFSFIINADYVYGLVAERFYLYNLRNILFSFLIFSIALRILSYRKQIILNKNMIFVILFFVYIFLSWGISSPAPGYGMYKLMGCALAIFLAFIPNLMNYTYLDIKKFYRFYLYFNLILILFMLSLSENLFSTLNTRLIIGEINPIWLSRFLGEVIILLLYLFNNRLSVWLKYILVAALFVGLVFTGSKGPILSLIVAVSIVNISTLSLKIKKTVLLKKYFSFALLFLGFIVLLRYVVFKLFSFDYLASRFIISNSESSYGEYSRSHLFEKALEFSYQSPFFGNGLGAFGYLYRGFDVRDYPHNMLLEVLSELGLVGLILITVPIVLTFIKFYKFSRNQNCLYLKLSMVLFIYYLLNSLVSGDLGFSNLKLFLFMGIINYIFIMLSPSTKAHIKENNT